MHGPERAAPAATQIVLDVWPKQMPSHLNPAPHAAAPAEVTSVQEREQKWPMAAIEHVE
jgi:hypothetical protein